MEINSSELIKPNVDVFEEEIMPPIENKIARGFFLTRKNRDEVDAAFLKHCDDSRFPARFNGFIYTEKKRKNNQGKRITLVKTISGRRFRCVCAGKSVGSRSSCASSCKFAFNILYSIIGTGEIKGTVCTVLSTHNHERLHPSFCGRKRNSRTPKKKEMQLPNVPSVGLTEDLATTPVPEIFLKKSNLENKDANWLRMSQMTYLDHNRVTRTYEIVERNKTPSSTGINGVAIFATLIPSNKLILISQYRPSVNKNVLEIPSGLIDEGETIEQAALRELAEETGYTGDIKEGSVSCPLYTDVGITNSSIAIVKVDCPHSQNSNPEAVRFANKQAEENIQVHLVETDNLFQNMTKLVRERNLLLDAKLYSYALGFCHLNPFPTLPSTPAALNTPITPTQNGYFLSVPTPNLPEINKN